MRDIATTFRGVLIACVLLSAGSAAPRPAQAVQTADVPSGESIQQQTQAKQGATLYFPDYVDGGGWSVQLAISNVARRASAAVAVTAYDQDGQSLPELFGSETTFEIPPLGSQVLRSVGTGEIRRGWIEVRTVPPSVSGLLTYRHSGSGVEVGVAPVRLGDRFALFVEESSEIGTGLALFKPEADSGVEIRIRDEAGTDPLGQELTVGDFQQQARTLPEWIQTIGATFPGDFRGQLLLRSGEDSSFAPLGLRFGKRKTSLSAVPGIPFLGEGGDGSPDPFLPTTSTAGPLYFPDYVDGGGWSVQLVLGNLDADRSVPVEVEVYDQQGRSVGGLFDSETRIELPAQGSRVLRSAGGTQIRRGWIKVEADSTSVRGLLVYRHGETGIEVGVAPVEPRDQFALFVEESSEIGTGLALFKPEADSRVEFRIRDEAGNDPLGDVYVPWRDFHQSARTLPEWLDVDGVETGFLKDFRGLLFLRTEDGSEFAPLGLRFGKETSALSAVPGIGIVDGARIDRGVGSDGGVEIEGGVGIDGGGMAPPPTVTLSVAPSSIDRGQSTTLRWSSTNAESVEITPDVGMVSTSGTQKVSPRTTTTYRITVRGADGQTASVTVTVTVVLSERAALEAFYEATDGPNWVNAENWLTDAPLGEWYGVEIDSQGRVIGLRMAEWVETGDGGGRTVGNGVTGSIPPELGSLTHLRVLDLSENQLEGEIPSVMGRLSSLEYLNLDGNALTGEVPPELGQLSSLERLQLQVNQLTGGIPPQLGGLPRLEILRLSVNRLTGPIPAQLGRLVRLKDLTVNDNELTGPIPADLGRLPHLEALGLDGNQLTGPIPAELGELSQLWWLSLDGNQLTGPIPSDLLRLGHLAVFSYFDNSGLCAPGTTDFITWLQGMERYDGPYCNESDVAALNVLYQNTGGKDWTNSGGWSGDGAVSEWYGVSTDSLGRVTGLDLSGNGLTGRLPRNLDRLAQLTELRIDGNALTGRLPLELARLPLQAFHYADTELCAPVEQPFRVWLKTVSSHEGSGRDCAPLTDRDILVALYEATDGPAWIESENWLTDAPLEEWQGVSVDVEGRVSVLWLGDNNLQGLIPPELGNLSNLRRVYLSGNQFTGPIPPELGSLAKLTWLWLSNNELTGPIPRELQSLANLEDLNLFDNSLSGAIPPELGNLVNLTDLSIGTNNLTGPIPPELGNLGSLRQLFIGDNPLTGSIPPELGNLANLERLSIRATLVTGPIPPELGNLGSLEYMWLNGNELTGPIPPELGNLDNLGYLYLFGNHLTGSVPEELAGLDNLKELYLSDNNLSGPVPSELGNLSNVTHLVLDGNALSGQVPAVLGNLSTLEELILSNNELTGPVSAEFGGMSSLKQLTLTNNPGMEGPLPLRLAELHRLEGLLAGGTDLCAPSNSRFQTWLNGVHKRRISPCFEGEPPLAYLTQAVQSREFPVPLVAGEKALLRVFPTARTATSQAIPAVRVRFYQDGLETHVENIPGKTAPIPTAIDEGNLATSVNAEIPAALIRPGLEMVIEVDPEGMLDPGLGVKKRIPDEGRLAVDVRMMPRFDLTLIPFLWRQDPDASIVDLVEAMAEDAEGHEMLWHTRTLLPIGDLQVTAHEPVLSTSNDAFALRANAQAIRAMEGGTGYYTGLMPQPVTGASGVGFIGDWVSFAVPDAGIIAHELGHNLSLYHAPCGDAGGPDPSFPESYGSTGAWGYDFREGGQLVRPNRPDLMSYCRPYWISDYHFTNALRYRLHTGAGGGQSFLVAAPGKSLLLWGGADATGAPFLEPAFMVQAPVLLPLSTGEYQIIGRNADGGELFSLSFQMPEAADGDGRSSFAFVLPAQSEWADELARITLSGPGGSVTLDEDTDRPTTILRNPRTGQIRGILRGAVAASPDVNAAVSALSLEPGLERLISHGLPDPEDWSR